MEMFISTVIHQKHVSDMKSDQKINPEKIGKKTLDNKIEVHNKLEVEGIIKKVNLTPEEKKQINAHFLEAAKSGDKAKVERLLKAGADVDAKDHYGMTALMWASKNGHKETVDILIKNKADVNAKDNNNGMTALMWASWQGYEEIVDVLIAAEADVNAKDKYGWTALMYACVGSKKVKIVEMLIAAGTDVNAKDNSGWTARILASKNEYEEIVEILKKTETKK